MGKNTYQLLSKTQTNGWVAENNDINGLNEFNMSPIQVATQAGNLKEMVQILETPGFDPKSAKNMGVFFEICRQENPKSYKDIVDTFRGKMKLDTETYTWSFKTPEDAALANMSLAEKINHNRQKMGVDNTATPSKPALR